MLAQINSKQEMLNQMHHDLEASKTETEHGRARITELEAKVHENEVNSINAGGDKRELEDLHHQLHEAETKLEAAEAEREMVVTESKREIAAAVAQVTELSHAAVILMKYTWR